MECTICHMENRPMDAKKSRYNRFIINLKSSIKNIKITGAEDLSKIR